MKKEEIKSLEEKNKKHEEEVKVKKPIITPKEVKPKYDIVEEVKSEPISLVKVNPYVSPKSVGGGGSSLYNEITNPLTGDVVLTRNPTQNIR